MIGVFGGSFDPPHRGHLNIICSFIKNFNSRLILIPNFLSPFKTSKGAEPNHILEMLQILKKEHGLERVEISDLELKRGGLSFTYLTLEELKNLYPDEELLLLLGEDNLAGLHRWKNIEIIFSLAKVLVYPRPGLSGVGIPEELEVYRKKIFLQNTEMNPASSSRVRSEKLEIDLSPAVLQYIRERGLYEFTGKN